MLQVVLMENIPDLGLVGDVVSVRPGYARNFLIPKGMAMRAIKEHIEEAERVKEEMLRRIAQDRQTAVGKKSKFDGLQIIVREQVTEKGTLYGSVGIKEIIEALVEQHGVEATHDQLILPKKPIKSVGLHPISLRLYEEIEANITLEVKNVAEGAGDISRNRGSQGRKTGDAEVAMQRGEDDTIEKQGEAKKQEETSIT